MTELTLVALSDLEQLLLKKSQAYEKAMDEGSSYPELLKIYKEIKSIQHQMALKRVHAAPEMKCA